eukprot:2847076-Pleurochrysis_carterae.AAC.1
MACFSRGFASADRICTWRDSDLSECLRQFEGGALSDACSSSSSQGHTVASYAASSHSSSNASRRARSVASTDVSTDETSTHARG